jgi:hypothetical protein
MPGDIPHDDLTGDEPRPWEQLGAVRRDVRPHRGHVLMWLGTATVACGVLADREKKLALSWTSGVTAAAGLAAKRARAAARGSPARKIDAFMAFASSLAPCGPRHHG